MYGEFSMCVLHRAHAGGVYVDEWKSVLVV